MGIRKNFDAETNELNQKYQLELKEKENVTNALLKSKEIGTKEDFLHSINALPNLDLNKYHIELSKSRNKTEHVYQLVK